MTADSNLRGRPGEGGLASRLGRDLRLCRLVAPTIERAPGATAVRFEGRALSFGELDRRSDRLARHLRDRGFGPRPERVGQEPLGVRAVVAAGKHAFLYLPTFRDSARPFLDIDWDRLDACMQSLDAVFFLEFHPVDATRYAGNHADIVQLFQDTDVYEVLPLTTALVSDYSSILFDYMLLDRPIISYTPDLEEFVLSCRSLNFHPAEIAVGPVCASFDELLAALRAVAAAQDPSSGPGAERYRAVKGRLHAHVDGRASERVLAAIAARFPLPQPPAGRGSGDPAPRSGPARG